MLLNIRSTSQVLGVIGDPIAHSFSPDMHNAAIEALGVDFCYVAFHVLPPKVGDAMRGVRGFPIRGLNVTIPHKLAVMEHMDRISEEALAVGAVNTISNEDGELVGYNTDVYGVLTALEQVAGVSTLPAHCVVLGAGGGLASGGLCAGDPERGGSGDHFEPDGGTGRSPGRGYDKDYGKTDFGCANGSRYSGQGVCRCGAGGEYHVGRDASPGGCVSFAECKGSASRSGALRYGVQSP